MTSAPRFHSARLLGGGLLALVLAACGPASQPAVPGTTGTSPGNSSSVAALGLQAEYFSRTDLSGPAVRQTDSALDFNWGRLSAARGVRPGQLGARWTAQLTAPSSGKYTLHLTATDGQARLSLGGQVVPDGVVVQLEAGKPQALQVVFTQTGSAPGLRLEWESQDAGIKREVIPAVRFAPGSVGRQNVATGGAPRGQNLLTNGDFEGGSASWIGNFAAVTPGYGGTGQAAGLTNFGYLQQNLPAQVVEVGATYTLTAFAKSSTTDACSVGLAYSDGSGNTTRKLVPFGGASGGDWQSGTLNLTLPYGSTFMAVYLGGNAGTCSFDNVALSVPTTATPQPAASSWVVNGDFETGAAGSVPSPWGAGTLVAPGRSGGQAFSNAHWSWTQQNVAPSTVSGFTAGQSYTLAASGRAINGGACSVLFQGGDDNNVLFSTVLDFRDSAWTSSRIAGTFPAGLKWSAVVLTTTDPECQFDDVSVGTPATVTANPPVVQLTSPVVTVGGIGNFGVDSVGVTDVRWAFSDGGTASGETAKHAFSTPGLYTATVTLTYPDSHTTTAQQQVSVLPEIEDIVKKRATTNSMTVDFDAGDPLPGMSYTYEFGDGTTGTGSRISHTFHKIGTYDYRLVIRDTSVGSQGLRTLGIATQAVGDDVVYDQSSWQTIWQRAPQAKFTIQGKTTPIFMGAPGVTVAFNATTSADTNVPASALTYSWDFGDGSTVDNTSGANVSHVYPNMGRYVVTLTLTNAYGLTDKYRDVIHVHDPKSNFRLNVEQSSPVAGQSLSGSDPIGTQTLKAQSATSNTLDYFPYVLPASNTVRSGSFRSLNVDRTPVSSYCNQLTVNQNGQDVYITKTEDPSLGTDSDGNAYFCTGLNYTVNRPMQDKTISSLYATSSRYLDEVQFSVFSKLSVPKIILGIYPDEYISGDVASPSIKEFKMVNPSTGKTEWMIQANVRQSEVANGNIKLKVPVLALDASGNYRTNATGRFKAIFGDSSLQSDCGDCTMLNGRGYITITLPISQYQATSQSVINLSTITLSTDNQCAQTDMFTTGNFRFTGCATLQTTNEYPTTYASGIGTHPYPPSASLFGHVYYGDAVDSVKALKIYARIGHVAAHTVVEFTAPYLLAAEHREDLDKVTAALVADGTLSAQDYGKLVLANIGYVFSYVPQQLRPPSFLAVRLASARGIGVTASALDDIVSVNATGGISVTAASDLLKRSAEKTVTALSECGPRCAPYVDKTLQNIVRKQGATPKGSLESFESELKLSAQSEPDLGVQLAATECKIACNLATISGAGLKAISVTKQASDPAQLVKWGEGLSAYVYQARTAWSKDFNLSRNYAVIKLNTLPADFHIPSQYSDFAQIIPGNNEVYIVARNVPKVASGPYAGQHSEFILIQVLGQGSSRGDGLLADIRNDRTTYNPEIYSERRPCPTCKGDLLAVFGRDVFNAVKYTVPYTDADLSNVEAKKYLGEQIGLYCNNK